MLEKIIKLSVLIPTYNREQRLKESLNNYLQCQNPHIEFLVIDNSSSDNTEGLVNTIIDKDNRVKYFKNPNNIGFNRNFFRGYLESNSEWICVMPDDDSAEIGFFNELISFIETTNAGIVLVSQKVGDGSEFSRFNSTTILEKGEEALNVAYMYSGSITGFTFNKDKINPNLWELDNSIYPQILIAMRTCKNFPLAYFVPASKPILGKYESVETTILDDMGRPIDYGLIERINILKKTTYDEGLKFCYYKNSVNILKWGFDILNSMNSKYSKKVLKSFFKNKLVSGNILAYKFLLENLSSLNLQTLTFIIYNFFKPWIFLKNIESIFFLIKLYKIKLNENK